MPKVSIISSSHNRPKTIKRTIQSVLDQSFTDFEYIIVDDHSDYDIAKVVSKFKDDRIKLIQLPENSGHDGKPKNIGIREAKGEYIAFLDDDDEWRPDCLKILLRYMDETGTDVIYGDYMNYEGSGKKSVGWSVNFSIGRLMRQNYITCCSTLIKRKALVDIGGFNEDTPRFKDWELWIRLYKNGNDFIHVPIIVLNLYQSESSVSLKYPTEVDENGFLKPTYFDPVECRIYPDKTSIAEPRPLRIAVYTLTNGRLDYLKQMSASLDRLAGFPFDWHVYDDGSEDGTREWLEAQNKKEGKNWRRKMFVERDSDHYIHHPAICPPKLHGLGRAWNRAVTAVRKGDYDVIVKADDDAIFITEGWLKNMARIYERNMRVCLSPCVEGLEGLPGGVLRQRSDGGSPYLMVADQVLGMVNHLGGLVYSTPPKLWDGLSFDEESVGNKDVLLSNHALGKGYSLFYMETDRVLHGPKGTAGQKADYPDRIR